MIYKEKKMKTFEIGLPVSHCKIVSNSFIKATEFVVSFGSSIRKYYAENYFIDGDFYCLSLYEGDEVKKIVIGKNFIISISDKKIVKLVTDISEWNLKNKEYEPADSVIQTEYIMLHSGEEALITLKYIGRYSSEYRGRLLKKTVKSLP